MMAFPVFITIAVAGLARVRFPKWFMQAAQIGAIVSTLFAGWMFYMRYVVIQALCPWCLTTDAATLVLLFSLIRYNAKNNTLCLGGIMRDRLVRAVEKDYDLFALLVVLVGIVIAIIAKYGNSLF